MPAIDIDLDGRKEQSGWGKCLVSLGAKGHKILFGGVGVDVNVGSLAFSNSGLVLQFSSTGLVIVTGKKLCVVR